MKTLLFTLEFPPFKGGVANYYGNLAKYWPIGEALIVMDNNRNELASRDQILPTWFTDISILGRKIKLDKIEYVLVGQILPLGTTAWLLSLIHPFKYAVFLHGMDFAYALKSPRKRWLATQILRRADAIIAANSYVADKITEFRPALADKIGIVNPGVESGVPLKDEDMTASLKSHYGLEGKTVLFTLGRLVRRKGIDQVIASLEQIPEDMIHNLSYVIGGDGPDKDYLKSLVPAKFSKKIIFLGEIREDEKWTWLHLSDIFVMPSRDIDGDFEGFGIVYLEANLCGKPIIAGRAGGVSDAVLDNYTGLLVDPESPAEISQAIIKLVANPSLRDELGRQGKERARAEFNWEKQLEKLLKIIKD